MLSHTWHTWHFLRRTARMRGTGDAGAVAGECLVRACAARDTAVRPGAPCESRGAQTFAGTGRAWQRHRVRRARFTRCIPNHRFIVPGFTSCTICTGSTHSNITDTVRQVRGPGGRRSASAASVDPRVCQGCRGMHTDKRRTAMPCQTSEHGKTHPDAACGVWHCR